MGTINRAYFDGLLNERDLSMRGLAKLMGTTHTKLSLVFNGIRRLSAKDVALMSSIFGVPVQTIMIEAGLDDRQASWIDVAGHMQGDGSVVPLPPGEIERTSISDANLAGQMAVQARTLNTPLAWMNGWVFFCQKDAVNPRSAIDRFCLVGTEDNEQYIGNISRGYSADTFAVTGPSNKVGVKLSWARVILHART